MRATVPSCLRRPVTWLVCAAQATMEAMYLAAQTVLYGMPILLWILLRAFPCWCFQSYHTLSATECVMSA